MIFHFHQSNSPKTQRSNNINKDQTKIKQYQKLKIKMTWIWSKKNLHSLLVQRRSKWYWLVKLNMRILYEYSILVLCTNPKEILAHTYMWMNMYMVIVCNSKKLNQTKKWKPCWYPLTLQGINKLHNTKFNEEKCTRVTQINICISGNKRKITGQYVYIVWFYL